MKKLHVFVMGIILLSLILFSLGFVSAALEVSIKPVSDSYIIELNEPATMDLIIKNLGGSDSFEVYSLVGIEITPKEKFNIPSGETKTIRIYAIPREALKAKRGFLTFEYLIKNSKGEIQKERMSINIAGLGDAILISLDNLYPNSEKINVVFKNTLMRDFNDLKIKMSSPFFVYEKEFPLKGLEMKEDEIQTDKNKLKTMDAGKYLVSALIQTGGKATEEEITIRFLEQENIESNEVDEGWIVRRTEVSKNNIGNVKKTVSITIKKNLISNLFTSVNIEPSRAEVIVLNKNYVWERELGPGEQLKVIVRTNWLYPIIVILLIIIVVMLIKRYLKNDLVLKKNVYFVKTKGGEFALKVHLKIKARRFAENIKIIDKLPPLAKLYEKFGAVAPDKIDLTNKRLEWNLEALNKGEERIFSYIIYSKIGIIGKFELPPAEVIYEREEKIKESYSNRAFFINEPERNKR